MPNEKLLNRPVNALYFLKRTAEESSKIQPKASEKPMEKPDQHEGPIASRTRNATQRQIQTPKFKTKKYTGIIIPEGNILFQSGISEKLRKS
uniref:Reverse transcriptase domain-containing protein n=1 Tax=Loa loa TaxID=7209 RepID=A0A1I7VQT9_LOALO